VIASGPCAVRMNETRQNVNQELRFRFNQNRSPSYALDAAVHRARMAGGLRREAVL